MDTGDKKLNLREMLKICFVAMLFLGLSGVATTISKVCINASNSQTEPLNLSSVPLVSVYPENISATELNQTVSIAIIIENVVDFYGFDIQIKWDPTVLHCLYHNFTVPVDSWPDPIPPSPYAGILHPGLPLADIVDETGNIPNAEPGTLGEWSYTSMGTPKFDGNGTVVVLTFQVLSTTAGCYLEFTSTRLSDSSGNPIAHTSRNGNFTIGEPKADFTYWPDVGVVDKPVNFTASVTDNSSNIETYMWDFGDGTSLTNTTVPTVSHNYTASDDYTVSLRVIDMNGKISSKVERSIKVVEYRDVEIMSVALSTASTAVNQTVDVTVKVRNKGLSGMADENCTLKVYYNASTVDWHDVPAANWTLIDAMNLTLYPGAAASSEPFSWNTTGVPTLEAKYYVMANLTLVPYERNVTDNTGWTSNPLFITGETINDLTVEKLDFAVAYAGHSFGLPVIVNENAKITVTVRNNGTVSEKTFNVTLYANNSLLNTWNVNESLNVNKEKPLSYTWGGISERGYYNITAEVTVANDNNTVNNCLEKYLHAIETPQLQISFTPETPSVNETVTLDASNSTHRDPEGNITEYVWKIYSPGAELTSQVYDELTGVTVSYQFGEEGNWTVVLQVTDNYGITYISTRTRTMNYQAKSSITVKSRGGIPLEYIIAIVIVIIVVAVALVMLYLRRRTAKT